MIKAPPKRRPKGTSPGSNIVYLRKDDQVHKIDLNKRRFSISTAMIFTLVLVFIGALSSVIVAAHMTDMRREVVLARNARDTALDANRILAAQMPAPFTLDEIEEIAQERLGMRRPDHTQIFYINVPPVSHVMFNPNADILPQDTTFWEEMRNFATDILNRIFGG